MTRLGLITVILLCSALRAQAWTETQFAHIAAGCTSSPCVVALTSTGANHFLGIALTANAFNTSLGAPPVGACNVAWVHAPSMPVNSGATGNSLDAYYCLQSVSGITSISQPITISAGTADVGVWEATPTLALFALDTGAVRAASGTGSGCVSCTGVPLTLSGNSDFIIVLAGGTQQVTGLTGTGFTLDNSNLFGDCFGNGITTGSLTAPATWVMSSSGNLVDYAIAFQETSSGGVTVVPRHPGGVF
jgi:hypothetical protein